MDGGGWGTLKRIGNDDFEKFRLFFSKYTNVDVAPLNVKAECTRIPTDIRSLIIIFHYYYGTIIVGWVCQRTN